MQTILVVEDNPVNRSVLRKILSADYHLIETENGKEALDVLEKYGDKIAGILLDLVMPVMDGYTFLSRMQKVPAYQNIPVIVSTGSGNAQSEKESLRLGAWDFVVKPYEPEILKFRIKNVIDRSQLTILDKLKYVANYDELTQIYSKHKFLSKIQEMLFIGQWDQYVFVRFDIDRFQLINSFYGTSMGDKLLKYLAKLLKESVSGWKYNGGIYGRMEADVFAFSVGYEKEEEIVALIEHMNEEIKKFPLNFSIAPAFGIYWIHDAEEEPSLMLDRANLAAKQIKGNYIKNYAFYFAEMSAQLEREQTITNEMTDALKEGQFVIYMQPKYNLLTLKPEGAEALVRWMHPIHGKISPGDFIPVFERNGFIVELDYYIWEQVCILLKKWLDTGRTPFPVSVNVSRVNTYNPNLVEKICSLTDKYKIPHHLLQLELTESAYTDNAEEMQGMLKRFQSLGFVILMDDFGSAYSSLNVLKDIEVDILKIDMKFLERTEKPGRGQNILASVVRMAKWLHIPVIAEGVETGEQVEFLRGIGCEYAQGFYFAKPVPAEEYGHLAIHGEAADIPEAQTNKTDELWNPGSQMDLLFSNVQQPMLIYEFLKDHMEILRVNKPFYDTFGYEDPAVRTETPMAVVKEEYREAVLNAFQSVALTGEPISCEYQRETTKGEKLWISLNLRYIDKVANKHVILGTMQDITLQKTIDMELEKYRHVLQTAGATGRVLIVDDVETNRVILKEMFQDEFEILQAENGQEALDTLKKEKGEVDLILLDLVMPVMDGVEFLHKKKMNPELVSVPVVMITSDQSEENQVKALKLGAADYIVKPFVKEMVQKRISNVIQSSRIVHEIMKEQYVKDKNE